ncbi:MAG: ribonuclease P protein component [Candidatus Brennerbacteria bacterium]|nr:ribonuclease P protein component [Candidatus Brennerbacteria bacterium]
MAILLVKRAPRNQKEPLRIVVGKAAVKGAVPRNLLKRRIRAIMRPAIRDSRAGFVIIVKPGAADLTYKELQKELDRNF